MRDDRHLRACYARCPRQQRGYVRADNRVEADGSHPLPARLRTSQDGTTVDLVHCLAVHAAKAGYHEANPQFHRDRMHT